MTIEIMAEKAKERATWYAYSEYCAEHPETAAKPTDIMFEPNRIKVEGYNAYKVPHSDVVFVYDDVQVYPMQGVERVYQFKR